MHYVLDRFEGDFAVLIDGDGGTLNIQISEIPKNAHEGDALISEGGIWTLDSAKTQERRSLMEDKLSRLLGRKKGDKEG